jgi:pyridoxamine 5'-phosphate oxidase
VIPDREWLETRLRELDASYPVEVPRPPHWGGFRLLPSAIEFWQGQPNRLHDRELWTRGEGGWVSARLSP